MRERESLTGIEKVPRKIIKRLNTSERKRERERERDDVRERERER